MDNRNLKKGSVVWIKHEIGELRPGFATLVTEPNQRIVKLVQGDKSEVFCSDVLFFLDAHQLSNQEKSPRVGREESQFLGYLNCITEVKDATSWKT